MRWTLRILAVFAVLLAAYTIWPLHGLYRLASVIEARDGAALRELVDFESLRRSLAAQVVATYLQITGKTSGLGQQRTGVAVGVGATIADPIVARYLNPETLFDLLNKGSTAQGATAPGSGAPAQLGPINAASLGSAWRAWLNSEYSGLNFYVSLPPDLPHTEQFRLKLRLVDWKWTLIALDLPEPLRLRLAQELAKASPQ
jgi:hypothetical protein